jgi:ABC-type histidine transport system ATPase subunit
MQQLSVKFYYFVLQTLLNMFWALLCPSSGARQIAVVASGFRMEVEVELFSENTSLWKPEAITAV